MPGVEGGDEGSGTHGWARVTPWAHKMYLFTRDDGGIGAQHEVDAGIGHQVGLELGDIHVECTIKAQRGSEGGDDLGNQAVEVGIAGALNVELATANVVHSLIVKHDSHIGMLQERVGGEHRVVGLHDSGGHLGRGVDSKAQLGLFAIVDRQALQEEGSQTRAGTTTHSVEHQKALLFGGWRCTHGAATHNSFIITYLQTSAVVRQLADALQGNLHNLLADGVVATGKVVGSILLAADELLRVEELAVLTGAHRVDHGGLQVNKDGTGDKLASTSLGEKGGKGIVVGSRGRQGAIRADAMLLAVELPAGITQLDTGLADTVFWVRKRVWMRALMRGGPIMIMIIKCIYSKNTRRCC